MTKTGRINTDTTFYAVLCRIAGPNGSAYFAERSAEDASSLDETIRDIRAGQIESVERVFAFNPVESVCTDVSDEIAAQIAGELDEEPRPDLRDFLEMHLGVGTALPAAA